MGVNCAISSATTAFGSPDWRCQGWERPQTQSIPLPPQALPIGTNSQRNISCKLVPDGFWQNGFFADFYFWAVGFSHGFCRRIFSPHFFCVKKCPEKSSRKIPGKIRQNLHNKNPRHISAEGPGQKLVPDNARLKCRDKFPSG